MYAREESEYFTAKRKAARAITGTDRLRDLPSNAEIREEIQLLADMVEGENRPKALEGMRIEALRFLRLLDRWNPKLIGSTLTGHVRKGSDIDLHVFCDSPALIADVLQDEGYECEIERKRVYKHHEERMFTHIHVQAAYPVELTVYATDKVNYPFKSSITGKLIERADATQLEAVLRRDNPSIDIEAELAGRENSIDPWELFELLLRPLEAVKQNPKFHPEGDALFHSLQVFDLARRVRAYDLEFQMAALLHDVGKAIDPGDHVLAGVEALGNAVTARTLWFVEHHMEAHLYRAGTLGARARRRLEESEDLEDLLLLSEIDEAGRIRGVIVPSVSEALEWLQRLENEHAGED